MNIWHWMERLQAELTEAGQAHSAQLIERLSDEVCEMEVERAEALLPELKALSKTLENPWLEVFVRHWEMRNRLGNSGEGETALAEAVSLFEFAHRADTVDCPQSICATQDLSSCYANLDGPGWVEERIEVCDETLARITPKWACFQCLSNEKAEALIDAGRNEEALAYLTAQQETLIAHGEDVSDGVREVHNRILLALGRHEEVLARIEEMEAENEGFEWRNISLPRSLQKAEALAGLERDAEAWDTLPTLDETNPGGRWYWLRAALPLLQRDPARNTWTLGRAMQKALQHYASMGAHRTVVEMALACADLALARDARWTAECHLQLAQLHRESLREPSSVDAALQAAGARVAAHPTLSPAPAAPDQLSGWLLQQPEDARNPEKEVDWLLQAVAARPDDVDLREHAASALQACGAERDAIALLWSHVERRLAAGDSADDSVAHRLLSALLAAGDRAGVERLAQLSEATAPKMAHWSRARLADHLRDWPSLERHCLALLALANDAHGARRLLATSLMEQRRFADAAAQYLEVCEANPDDRSPRWDYLAAASAAEDWAGVRTTAAHLSMELSTDEGPIDEDWGWVILRLTADGKSIDYYARRSGPVHATVLENAPPAHQQRVGDRVVFDAEYLYPPPEDEEERKHFMPTFRAVHTLSQGGYGPSWIADGPHPGEEAFDVLREAMHARDWRVWIHSSDDYTLSDSEGVRDDDNDDDAATLRGIIFTVSAPESTALAQIDAALDEATAAWTHRPSWLALAEASGSDTSRHRAAIERYGL